MQNNDNSIIEVRPVMSRVDMTLFTLISILLVGTLVSFGVYWVRLPEWHTSPVVMAAMTVFLLTVVAQFTQAWTFLPTMRRPLPPEPEPGRRVAMITTFVPAAEPIEMLEETLRDMVAVRYPHECWVLDEGDDERVKRLCTAFDVQHFSRKGRADLNTEYGPLKTRTKYGNVNAWLKEVGYDNYDFVSAFDPDHAPAQNFLERTIGYFRDPRVGFVQAAQVYYNGAAGWIARGAAEETYSYYSSTLMSGFGAGYVVVVGCHNTHRVSALKEVDGFGAHDADDLLIGLNYLANRWRGVYVPETLAIGITPVDWPTYLTQQRRWARSVFEIKFRLLPQLWSRLSPRVRFLAFGQGLSYIVEFLLPVMGAALLCGMLISGHASVFSRLFGSEFLMLLLVFAAIDFFRQQFFLNPTVERGLNWRAGVLRSVKWAALGTALAEATLGRRGLYEITSKVGAKSSSRRVLLPQFLLGGAVALSYAYALSHHPPAHWSLHFWPIVIVISVLIIFATTFRQTPAAFDRTLLKRARTNYFRRA